MNLQNVSSNTVCDRKTFLEKILTAFHIEQGDFENNLHLGYVYESLLHQWIYGSYQKGKSVEETICFIFRMRNQILLTPK